MGDSRGFVSSSCNCGDGTDQRFKYLMSLIMIVKKNYNTISR